MEACYFVYGEEKTICIVDQSIDIYRNDQRMGSVHSHHPKHFIDKMSLAATTFTSLSSTRTTSKPPFCFHLNPMQLLHNTRLHNRPIIPKPPIKDIKTHTKNHRRPVKQTAPIHSLRRNRHRRRPEAEKQRNDTPNQTEPVSEDAELAEFPWPVVNLLATDAFPEEQTDGNGVAGQESGDKEGGDGIESFGAADIDESEEEGDDGREADAIKRQPSPRLHLADISTPRHTAITGKGPHLTRRGGQDGDGGEDHEGEDERGHGCGAGDAVGCLVEDLDEGEAGWGREGVVDVPDAEEDREEHGEAESAV